MHGAEAYAPAETEKRPGAASESGAPCRNHGEMHSESSFASCASDGAVRFGAKSLQTPGGRARAVRAKRLSRAGTRPPTARQFVLRQDHLVSCFGRRVTGTTRHFDRFRRLFSARAAVCRSAAECDSQRPCTPHLRQGRRPPPVQAEESAPAPGSLFCALSIGMWCTVYDWAATQDRQSR